MVAQRRAIDATFGTHAAVGVAQRQPQAVVQRTFFDTAKVGLELTFNNAFTNRLTDDGGQQALSDTVDPGSHRGREELDRRARRGARVDRS
jgi:hypothetical protein